MIPRLLMSSLFLLVLTTPVRADEILFPESGITITVPSGEGWALRGNGTDAIQVTHEGDIPKLVGFNVENLPCRTLLEAVIAQGYEEMHTAHPMSSSWSSGWTRSANGTALLCMPLDVAWSLGLYVRNTWGAIEELSPIVDTIVRAVRHQRSEYESKEGLWLPHVGVFLMLETDGTWWTTMAREGTDLIYPITLSADVDIVSVSKTPAEVSNCDAERAAMLEDGVEDRELAYAILGSGVRGNDGESVVFCGHFAGADYIVAWVGELSATGANAEVTRALVRALTPTQTSTPVYEVAGEDEPYTMSEPVPVDDASGGDDDDGLTVRSSLTQIDVRAGVALLAPAMVEDTTGFAFGASLPPRFVNSLLVVEGNVMFMNGGDVGTMLEVHAGVGIGKRFDGLEVAWTGGVGATGLGHLDDGGAEEGGGPHVYTGPYLRLDNGKFALGVEGALILNSHPDQSRVRVDLTTATWKRKLGLAIERSRAFDGSAVTVSLAVGLF